MTDPRLGTTAMIRKRRLYWLRMLVAEHASCRCPLPGGALGRGATPDLAALARKGLVRNAAVRAERLWEPTDEGRMLVGAPVAEPIRINDVVRVVQTNHLLTGQEVVVTDPSHSDALLIEAGNENGRDAFRREDVELVRRAAEQTSEQAHAEHEPDADMLDAEYLDAKGR